MNETVKIKGIVINSASLGDNGKMLTVLTEERGVISVAAHGVKSLKNKNAAAVTPLCYSEFVLKEKGDIYTLNSADVIESFYSLCEDVVALSYGVYFAQLAAFTVGKNNPCDEELRLLLNTLYLMNKDKSRCAVLCSAFELKICEAAGIAPYIDSCRCGEEGEFFDIKDGEIKCALHKTEKSKKISHSARVVIEYVQNADMKDALSFDTPDVIAREISSLTEEFMREQFGRLPRGLEYLKKVIY